MATSQEGVNRGPGRPRKWTDDAERARAYRRRKAEDLAEPERLRQEVRALRAQQAQAVRDRDVARRERAAAERRLEAALRRQEATEHTLDLERRQRETARSELAACRQELEVARSELAAVRWRRGQAERPGPALREPDQAAGPVPREPGPNRAQRRAQARQRRRGGGSGSG